MATNNSWNNQIAAAKSAITLNSGTNAINISTDASATTVNVGTGAAAKTVTVGSTTSTSPLTLNSGSGGITMTGVAGVAVSNKNYVTINTSTGGLGSEAGPAGGSMVLLQTQTASSSANISFTSNLTSTYATYLFLFRNLVQSAGTPQFQILYSTNGGSSYLGSGYQSGYVTTAWNANAWTNTNGTSVGPLAVSNASFALSGFLYVSNIGVALTASYTGELFSGNSQFLLYGMNTTTNINAIRYQFSSGDIASGTISLYGITS